MASNPKVLMALSKQMHALTTKPPEGKLPISFSMPDVSKIDLNLTINIGIRVQEPENDSFS